MNMQHAAWTFLDMRPGHASWTCGLDMQHGHAAWTWTCSIDMDTDMDMGKDRDTAMLHVHAGSSCCMQGCAKLNSSDGYPARVF
jgi:hypothetical protein